MAEQDATPLTDDERAELERLRAEKARREQEERDRRERAELESLRAEARKAEKPAPAPQPALQPKPRRKPEPESEELTFGQRMVTAPKAKDDDDIPGMAPAQKIIIALALFMVVAGGLWMFLNGGH